MAAPSSVFSQTLQSITNEKLAELSKKRSIFEQQKAEVFSTAQAATNAQAEVKVLLDGVKKCFAVKTARGKIISGVTSNPRLEVNVRNIERFLGQAAYDPSVSSKLMSEWKTLLMELLDMQSAKYEYASLYAQLVTEWLSSERNSEAIMDLDQEDLEELASKERLGSRTEWERAVFQAFDTDEQGIMKYLSSLFGKKESTKALKALKENLESFEHQMAASAQFNHGVLQWTIYGLLSSDLLTDDERAVLKDFRDNPTILAEVADVLNMRMAALDTWTWGEQVSIEQRKKLNGTYGIYMHEELLQAIFLQYIGVKWSVFFKGALKDFAGSEAWTPLRTQIPLLDMKRREYFLGPQSKVPSLQSRRQKIYRSKYFMTQLMDYVSQSMEVAEGDEEADFGTSQPMAQQAPMAVRSHSVQIARKSTGGKAARRMVATTSNKRVAIDNDEMEEDEEDEDDTGPKNPMELKQSLLHLLSTEILISTRIHGELSCFHAEFDRWNSALPHSTIRAVLRFFGVSARWMGFFQKFMEAPLAFPGEPPRLRKRGVPGSHVISEVLGEAILFCMDFGVNQNTKGTLLYRMHDDFWFWSPTHQTCVVAWKTIEQFAKVMGVTLNRGKAGSVRINRTSKAMPGGEAVHPVIDEALPQGMIRWGFLYMDPQAGRFVIDEAIVDEHINELQHQLADKHSIFAWIQAWNTYANTFFTTNFGRPSYCYGQAHIDMILSNLARIQRKVFGSESVVQSIKSRLQQRFGIEDVPDGYVFFPTEVGGLEVMSPFIGMLQIRDSVPKDPEKLLDEWQEAAQESYRVAKLRYDRGQVQRYSLNHPDWKPKDETFFSVDEFAKYQEEFEFEGKDLLWVFDELMKRPSEEEIEASAEVMTGLNQLSDGGGINRSWYSMTSYWKWVAQLYGPEMIAKFGKMSIVDAGLLPIGMVSLFRSGRVKWRG